MNIIIVSDRSPIDISAALCVLVAQKAFKYAKFHIAIPSEGVAQDEVATEIFKKYSCETYEIPEPGLKVCGRDYRIINKINALRFFYKSGPAVLVDSDYIFIKSICENMFFGRKCAAVPEHGRHLFPWVDLYAKFQLPFPTVKVVLGSGEVSDPWLNAGFVYAENPSLFGQIWYMYALAINDMEEVPERYPYLDQIALPLAMTHLTGKAFSHDCVLSERFNQNLYSWAPDQSYVANGFAVHHHNRVVLLRKYFGSTIIPWIKDGYPEIDYLLEKLTKFSKD